MCKHVCSTRLWNALLGAEPKANDQSVAGGRIWEVDLWPLTLFSWLRRKVEPCGQHVVVVVVVLLCIVLLWHYIVVYHLHWILLSPVLAARLQVVAFAGHFLSLCEISAAAAATWCGTTCSHTREVQCHPSRPTMHLWRLSGSPWWAWPFIRWSEESFTSSAATKNWKD